MREQSKHDTTNTCLAFVENITKTNFNLKYQGMFHLCKRKKDSYIRIESPVGYTLISDLFKPALNVVIM